MRRDAAPGEKHRASRRDDAPPIPDVQVEKNLETEKSRAQRTVRADGALLYELIKERGWLQKPRWN